MKYFEITNLISPKSTKKNTFKEKNSSFCGFID